MKKTDIRTPSSSSDREKTKKSGNDIIKPNHKDKEDDDCKSETIDPNVVTNYQSLPAVTKQVLERAELSEVVVNENWNTIINVLTFTGHLIVKNPNEVQKEKEFHEKFYAPFDPKKEAELTKRLSNPRKSFKIQNLVGTGGFGCVYAAMKDSKKIAVKKCSYVRETDKRVNLHEVFFLKNIKHPNIVKMYKAYLVEEEIWITMEFMEGGTLTEARKKQDFSATQISYISHELLQALKYLHDSAIAHRDLKSANIMLTVVPQVKIVDFGLCCKMPAEGRSEVVGSPFWIPPEMVKHQKHHLSVDIWSFGISLIELANGEPPNRKSSVKAMTEVALHGVPQPLKAGKWPPVMLDFINKCLTVDPFTRPSSHDLLKHEFLKHRSSPKDMRDLLMHIFTVDALSNLGYGI